MKILILTKRQTTHRDILDERFGRSWHLPHALAELGHILEVHCLSYQDKTEGDILTFETGKGGKLTFNSLNAGPFGLFGFLQYARQTNRAVKEFRPDIIYAMSDTLYAILGHRLARQHRLRFFCDCQDNYETYASARLPGILPLFRRALAAADGVTCVSALLSEQLARHTSKILILNNGVSREVFFPRDQQVCRRELNLPTESRLIGFAGSLTPDRGLNILFEGFERLKQEFRDLHLVLAGSSKIDIPRYENIHHLGLLPHAKIPVFLNALDLAVICNQPSRFYDYTFPIKTYEILACGIPFIASDHVSVKQVLRDYPDCLYLTGNIESFIRAAQRQLREPNPPRLPVVTWKDLGQRLESFFRSEH